MSCNFVRHHGLMQKVKQHMLALVIGVMIATTLLMASRPAMSQMMNIDVEIFDEQKSLVGFFFLCSGAVPDVEVMEAPKRGDVTVSHETIKLNPGNCSGYAERTVNGFAIWYTPRRAQVGDDQFLVGWWGPAAYNTSASDRGQTVRKATIRFMKSHEMSIAHDQYATLEKMWNCDEVPISSDITIAAPPAHGTLELKQSEGHCRTGNVPAIEFVYKPSAGFTGNDHLEFRRKLHRMLSIVYERRRIYDIVVR